MSELTVLQHIRPATSASPAQAQRPVLKGVSQLLLGWLLGLFPLVLGLLLATWGAGAFQALGVVVMASAPVFVLIVPLLLLASGLSRWMWIGALMGCLTTALLDGAIIARVLLVS